jgi:hypothetical protein
VTSPLERQKIRKRWILTNFTPPSSVRELCKKHGILIFHYSHLDEALSHETLRAAGRWGDYPKL